jgi:hypothetical protein
MKALMRLSLFLIVLGFWAGVFQFNTDKRELSYHPDEIKVFTSKMKESVQDLTGFNTSIVEREVNKISKELKQ